MSRKATTLETIRKQTVEDMKKLNTYKEEYDRVINVYCSLIGRFLQVNKTISEEDYEIRSSLCLSEENLRRDVLRYANELGLTPTGLKKIKSDIVDEKKQSALAKALSDFA